MNISNAALFGLQTDLDIVTGTKYNTALTIFFVPYIIFEVCIYSRKKEKKKERKKTFVHMRINPLTSSRTDSIEYSFEETRTSCVVVVLYGHVWIRHGDAGRICCS